LDSELLKLLSDEPKFHLWNYFQLVVVPLQFLHPGVLVQRALPTNLSKVFL
jgi:hypothetical protein